MRKIVLLVPFLAVTLLGASPNWGTTVTTSANGAYVLGNPKAKVRVVEYLSYTCSHCAHLVAEGGTALKTSYAQSGNVAIEIRNAVRDQLDFTMALAARCGGSAKFFGNNEALFAAQTDIFAKANALKPNAKAPVNTQLVALAQGAGVQAIMAKRGITPAQLNACLISKPNQDAVVAMTNEAWTARKIPYTPYVLINGTASGTTWNDVEPTIKAALAQP